MNDMLQKICEATRAHVRRLKQVRNLSAMETEMDRLPAPRGFIRAIQNRIHDGEIALIAEMKKASPSAGLLCEEYRPALLARAYENAGATCLSVLTDIAYFQGSSEDLITARAVGNLPVLRKDFMLDVWQVAESRAMGADCILLIMAILDDARAADLHAAALFYGMDVLIESHDQGELERALKLPSGLIGINNRNLNTLQTDLATTEELARYVPKDRILVSESGIVNAADISRLQRVGAQTFLVGESLLKHHDVEAAVRQLL